MRFPSSHTKRYRSLEENLRLGRMAFLSRMFHAILGSWRMWGSMR